MRCQLLPRTRGIVVALVLASRPVEAQRSGALVGLSTGRTFWIAPDANGIRVLERDGVLVVPRQTGFWSVGFSRARTPPDTGTYETVLDPPPAEVAPWGYACHSESCRDWFALGLWTAPLGAPAPEIVYPDDDFIWQQRRAGGVLGVRVTMLTPGYIALTEHSEYYGSASGTTSYIGALDSLAVYPYIAGQGELGGDPVQLDSVVVRRFMRECSRQYRSADDVGISIADLGTAERSRYIARKNARWRLFWHFGVSGGAGRGAEFSCELPYRVPASIVRRDSLVPAWSAIRRAVPKARDAASSPSGDLVIVLTDFELLVFAPTAGSLGAPKATVPVDYADLVMVEWATGRSVARWTAELSPHFRLVSDVGLLLGSVEPWDDADSLPDRVLTRWIIASGGTVRLAGTFPTLVVPGARGFWRVGITRQCVFPDTTDREVEPRTHCADMVWSRPAADPVPPITMGVIARDPCTSDEAGIHFASPTVLSLSLTQWRSECYARSFSDDYRKRVRSLARDDTVSFASLGPGAGDAYREAALRARNVGEADGPPSPQSEFCHTSPEQDDGWRVRREQDRWVGELYQQGVNELCMFSERVAWPLPATVVGYAEPAVDWSLVRQAEPGAEQAFASPDGALMVVVTPDAIRLYATHGGRPAEKLLEYARPADVVMVQWAVGRSVARWTAVLDSMR